LKDALLTVNYKEYRPTVSLESEGILVLQDWIRSLPGDRRVGFHVKIASARPNLRRLDEMPRAGRQDFWSCTGIDKILHLFVGRRSVSQRCQRRGVDMKKEREKKIYLGPG